MLSRLTAIGCKSVRSLFDSLQHQCCSLLLHCKCYCISSDFQRTDFLAFEKMVISFVTYIKNRRIGSTYPSIDAKPDSRVKKTVKKISKSLVRACICIMNEMPFIHPRASTGLINIIELQGTFYFSSSHQMLRTFMEKFKSKLFGQIY